MNVSAMSAGRLLGLVAAFALGSLAAPAAAVSDPPADSAPSLTELGAATYRGIYKDPVTLTDGLWEGKPFVAGGASRPSVQLLTDLHPVGDLNGDGRPEAVALLAESSGGSGTRLYVAAVSRQGRKVVNLATARVGDRVQVRAARVVDRRIELDVVQVGPEDPACCPGQKATRRWSLKKRVLTELPATITGRLSLADISGAEWVLTKLAWKEPAPAEPHVTFQLDGDKIAGSAGCNRYTATATGRAPGEITIGPVAATRKMCPPDIMVVETPYLQRLGAVTRYQFLSGQLLLAWEKDGARGELIFVPAP